MISKRLQVLLLLVIFIYFVLLLILLNKKRLSLKYTLLWIFAGLVMLLLSLFPQILHAFAQIVGIYDATNALFATVLFCGIIIMVSLTSIVSKLNERIKQLAQYVALLEKRLRDVEAEETTNVTEREKSK